MDAGVREGSSFAGVVEVLDECRERVKFGGCRVPALELFSKRNTIQ